MRILTCFRTSILSLALVHFAQVIPARAGDYTMGGTFPVGQYPIALAVGDFNRDGRPDLAVANQGSGNVSILICNGDGTFQTASNYDAGLYPQAIVVADFNRDGKLDVAVANQTDPGTVSILLGNGDGTFQGALSFDTGTDASSIIVGDFNRDGFLDLATGNATSNVSVSVLLGNGNGIFNPPLTYYTVTNSSLLPPSIACADLDLNGTLDIVVANPSLPTVQGTISVLIGDGNGGFVKTATNYRPGRSPSSLVVADFDHDGKLDLAVADGATITAGSGAAILLGNGDATFQSASLYTTAPNAVSLVTVDYAHDGPLDAALIDDSGVSVLPGISDGSFGTPDHYTVSINAIALATGDFNHDRKPDLAIVNFDDPGSVSILLNTSTNVDLVVARSNNTAIVSWAYPSTGFTLESTLSLSNPKWLPVQESAHTNDGFWEVPITLTPQSSRFFRLHLQP